MWQELIKLSGWRQERCNVAKGHAEVAQSISFVDTADSFFVYTDISFVCVGKEIGVGPHQQLIKCQ